MHRSPSRSLILACVVLAVLAPTGASADEAQSSELAPLLMLPPALGVKFGHGPLLFTVSFPLSVQVGPEIDRRGALPLRQLQLVVEPTLAFGGKAQLASVAWGVRRRWRGGTLVRPALGVWTDLAFAADGLSSRVAGEAVLYVGECCRPGSMGVSWRVYLGLEGPLQHGLQAFFSFY